jgi:integrase
MSQRSVRLQVREDRLSLRWSYQGGRYYLALGLYDNPLARKVAQSRANQIEADLVTGNFDTTLQKYKGKAADAPDVCGLTAVELFDRFTKQRGVDARTLEKYAAIRSKLFGYFNGRNADIGSEAADEFRQWLDGSLAPISQKEYIGTIATCWTWAVKQNLLSASPWGEVMKRVKVPPRQRPRPFTQVEITAIIGGFRESRYYRHYTDFVLFLLSAGCRTGEAIGLRWSHLSEDCGKVWIGESVTRGVRKSTKTNKSREFRLTPGLKALLLQRRPQDYRPDDLVFPSPKGGPIDDHNFRNRAWLKVLASSNVAYRKPYNTRHTFISHALAKGVNPMAIAQMTGHDPEILFKHYAADIQGGLELPDMFV